MNTLGIDTSGETLFLCLKTDELEISVKHGRGYRHAETLVPWIRSLCLDADLTPTHLDLVAVSLGPGSFTGIRIGLATAKAIASAASCAIVGVPTLDALAWGLRGSGETVVPVIDARKRRVYAAVYRGDARISGYLDLLPSELNDAVFQQLGGTEEAVILTGPFAREMHARWNEKKPPFAFTLDVNSDIFDPHCLAVIGESVYRTGGSAAESIAPIYLRRSEAEINRDRVKHEGS